MAMNDRGLLEEIWWAGVGAVRGENAVRSALASSSVGRPDAILAVGKAAASMAQAAVAAFGTEPPCLVLTKYGHAAGVELSEHVTVIEAAHPVPDEQSLAAGRAAVDLVSGMAPGSHLLMLVSGGASALVEVPKTGLRLDHLARENSRLLSSGLDIHAMNARRRVFSQVKGGGLLSHFRGAETTVLAISDVEGDSLDVIGSGIGASPPEPEFRHDARIVASNAIARAAAAEKAQALGFRVLSSDETLYTDVAEAADTILGGLDGTPGVRIWGGEPTTVLPDNPGEGGRNQALALLVARAIAGRENLAVLVGGTDGSDGPTRAAGGVVTGGTWTDEGQNHLDRADSGPYLRARGALLETGPTGTNVMDLAIAIQR